MLKSKRFNTAATIILTVLVIITLLPLALIVISSFTKESALIRNGYSFWPQEWSLDAYYYMIKQGAVILRSYGVSVFVTAVGTAASVILTTMLAYPMPGHSAGNCMVIDSKTGILFSGDAILSTPTLVIDGFPAVDHAELLTVEAFHTALVQHMKQLNKVKWLCPSHGRLMLSNKYVSAMQHCTEEILKAPDKWERYDYIPSLPGMIRCVDDAMIVYTLNRVHKVLEA